MGLAVALASAAGTAAAGSGEDARFVVEHIFAMADTDESGALSAAEYEEAGLARYGVSFETCDADGDGETTLAEYLALFERHHGGTDEVGI